MALDDGAGAGTLDAVDGPGPEAVLGLRVGGGAAWRRAVEVLMVFFGGLGALSFTSTRRALRE
jgi:hypothetical protein